MPINALRVEQPLDGWGPKCDFYTHFQSFLIEGNDLRREPLDVVFDSCLAGQRIKCQSLLVNKGATRVSILLTILKHAMLIDPSSEDAAPMVRTVKRWGVLLRYSSCKPQAPNVFLLRQDLAEHAPGSGELHSPSNGC